MVKSPYYDKNGLKKGAWSPEEDKKLREYIQKYGHWNWRELPKYAGLSRCGKSCRLRWTNYLRPDVKRGRYTDEEDEIIIKLHEELGNKWSMIASKLPGRTDNEIKNRWHTYLKKLSKQNKTKSKVKEQLSEASQIETCQNRSSEPESIPIDGSIHHISGSSPLSLETCSGDFSSMSPLDALQSGMNLAVEDNLASSESTENFGGDFWSEPFLGDNSLVPSNCPLPFFDEGFMLPYMPYHEDVIDFYWDWVCK